MKDRENQESSKLNKADLSPFMKLGLKEPILSAIRQQGFSKPTLIQETTIPLVLAGRDIMAGSATGSGKTLAFGAGIIQTIKRGHGIQALILTPTRELAEQVSNSLKLFSAQQPTRFAAVYGGVSIGPQIKELRRADVVVGTPGRILDHLSKNTIRFDRLKTLVLDEADRMFDMGFVDDVEKIIKRCPKQRQTLLFSATLSGEINDLAKRHTTEVAKVVTKSFVDPLKLTQVCYEISGGLKFSLLVHLLKHETAELGMVFCNTRRSTDMIAENLKYSGIEAIAIHGGISQDKRNKAIKHFHTKKAQVLVCTDVAARGLDIKGVSHVYNYDIPADSKQYTHRIGRTARAGEKGKAINILSLKDKEKFSRVLRDNTIAKAKTPYVERANIRSQTNSRPY